MKAFGYSLDTNILRPLLRNEGFVHQKILNALHDGLPVKISALVYFETRRGLLAAGASRQLHRFEELCDRLGLLELDRRTLDKAAEIYADLRRRGKLIEDADLLIAASAIVNDLCLVTHNVAHFDRISELAHMDWLAESEDGA